MRSDENVKQKKRDEGELGEFGETTPRNSFSGGERDNLFLSDGGEQFYDVAALAGLDDPGDGRTSSLFDYDRDGWTDLLVASSTVPTLQLYRNRIGEAMYGDQPASRVIAVRLIGGNRISAPSADWSARDGYGATLRFDLGDGLEPLLREHRCGDGRAGQNSNTLLVGIGDRSTADLSIRWPSGREQQRAEVPVGSLVTVYENPAQAPDGHAFVIEPYRRDVPAGKVTARASATRMPITLPAGDSVPRLNLLTAMSTHCVSCKKAQPQVALLRDALRAEGVGVFGVPVDLEESAEDLDAYVAARQPAYEVLSHLPMDERRAMKEHITEAFLDEVTPSTVITDPEGRVLATMQGVPTISQVRRLLRDL